LRVCQYWLHPELQVQTIKYHDIAVKPEDNRTGGKETNRRGGCVFVLVILVALALLNIDVTESDVQQKHVMNAYEKWKTFHEETRSDGDNPRPNDSGSPLKLSYLDGPYPKVQDDGAPVGMSSGGWPQPLQWNHLVSDIFFFNILGPHPLSYGGGDFLAGDVSEVVIGDQNGNGILEWVVYYVYLPWMNDGIDNDGDGCVDERADDGVPCDLFPDAMVIYETGGLPRIGGNDGTLLVSVDWFSDGATEVYRAFVTPKWKAHRLRGVMTSVQIAGEFISYMAHETINDVNANPEMDNDQNDWYVGNIDARGFPVRPPINHVCSAGYQLYMGATFQRDDGWVVTSYELWESFDDRDWNGDGDRNDYVAAYYAVDPISGDCRIGVNTGVSGEYPTNAGTVLTPGYTIESADGRDWNSDGDTFDSLLLYHDINSTWSLKGRIYASYTYFSLLIIRQKFGFGFTGLVGPYGQFVPYPLKFGGSYYLYVGYPAFYITYFWLVSDEDGDHQTSLPKYEINYGQPAASLGGRCVIVSVREYYLEYIGVDLIGDIADGNGDGDASDTLGYIYCPDEIGGGGHYIVEPTSNYAKGLYSDPGMWPFIWAGYVYYDSAKVIDGRTLIPIYNYETALRDDCNGDLIIRHDLCYFYYRLYL
jgi:hypothetical protein